MKLTEVKVVDDSIMALIEKNCYSNPYLYIDSIVYGLNGDNIKTFLGEHNKIVLYHYYSDLQILQLEEINKREIECVVEHIKK